MAIKVLKPNPSNPSQYIGFNSYFVKGLEYALSKGATVSNWSLGGGGISESERTQYENIASNNPNHLMVFAAGNDAQKVTSNLFGCGLDLSTQICVGSSTQSDSKSWFSNYGKELVDVFAPGSDILSTTPNDNYSPFDGTSMAAPHVTGLAALIRSMKTMTAVEAKNYILNNVQVKSQYANDASTSGLIDAFASVNAVVGKHISNLSSFNMLIKLNLYFQLQHHLHQALPPAHLHHPAMDAPTPIGKATTTAMMKTTPLVVIGMVVTVAATMLTQPIAALVNAWIHLNKVKSKMY